MHDDQIAIPCSLYRGGTSKAVLFLDEHLPQSKTERDACLLRIMGSPDIRQIDGLGGADPLTSRVGIITKDSSNTILFQFALIHIKDPIVEYAGFCGNIISAVAPFAIDQGLIAPIEPITKVPIYDINTKMTVIADVPVLNGKPLSKGNYAISGVPRPGSKITLHLQQPPQTTLLSFLPTHNTFDLLHTSFGSITVSLVYCIDPVIFVLASDIGLTGKEETLINNPEALAKLEELRKLGAEKMHLPCSHSLPKVVFIAKSSMPSSIVARMLAMGNIHKAYAVSTAACTLAAAFIPNSLIHQLIGKLENSTIIIEHPQGNMEITAKLSDNCEYLEEIVVYRTARCIMQGIAYV